MRVRVTEDTRVYWSYAVQELNEGDELAGEFARYLVDTGSPVEILDGNPQPPAPAAEQAPDPAAGPAPAADQAGPPVDGTIDDLMTWIAGDPGRAAAALAAEQAKDKPRATVVKRLTALAD